MTGLRLLACFAHPDDEAFPVGGLLARNVAEGRRVRLVTTTLGEEGEIRQEGSATRETLGEVRRIELACAVRALSLESHALLDYRDSGMAGWESNDHPRAYINAPDDLIVERFVREIREFRPQVMLTFEPGGLYGHPDHIKVHFVGLRAAEFAGTEHLYETTTNRDHMKQLIAANPSWSEEDAPQDVETFGLPASEITTIVDVSSVMGPKRQAMEAHATQIGDFGPFLAMPPETLELVFGREWFRRVGGGPGLTETQLPL